MRSFLILLVSIALLSATASLAPAQGYLNFGKPGASTTPTPTPGVGSSGQANNVPYYVDPARFYYNRPGGVTSGLPNAHNTPRSNHYRFRHGRPYSYYYYHYGYPQAFPYYGYYGYYGGPVYNYGGVPGATVHVGPFIPF